MKKTINRKVYNTDTAELIAGVNVGTFGDPAGYEEALYKTKKGLFFLYGKGGAESKYVEEDIVAVDSKTADAWLQENRA